MLSSKHMAMRTFQVLLVDDTEECQLAVRQALRNSDLELATAGSLAEARAALAKAPTDLLLLDLGLPDGSGFSLLEEIPESTAVFLFTGNQDMETKVRAFGLGADDYLTKPVNPLELKARVEMRLRKKPGSTMVLNAGPLRVDFEAMRAYRVEGAKQCDLDLTTKELKILSTLIKHRGKVLSRPEIVKEVWGQDVHVLDRTVDSHIAGLRRKLKGEASLVESLPQQGYRFRTEG